MEATGYSFLIFTLPYWSRHFLADSASAKENNLLPNECLTMPRNATYIG